MLVPEVFLKSVPSGVGMLSFHASLPCNDGWGRSRGKATGPFEGYLGKRKEVLREVDYKGNSFNPNSFECFRGRSNVSYILELSQGLSQVQLPSVALCTPQSLHPSFFLPPDKAVQGKPICMFRK